MFQRGMRQHYELGSFLKNRYKGFLSESYERREVGVTDVQYASCHLSRIGVDQSSK